MRTRFMRRGLPAVALAFIIILTLSLSFLANHTTHGATTQAATMNLTQYVNPFAGTAPNPIKNVGFSFNNGDDFPGADMPTGMMQWSPDTSPTNIPGGYYYPDTTIKGFGVRHFSGRGITAYGDLPFMPFVGAVSASPGTSGSNYNAGFSHTNESAHPGYYSVTLNSGVKVELTTNTHSGIAQFTFPTTSQGTLIFNTSGGHSVSTSSVSINGTQFTGSATAHVGGGSENYTIYYVGQFDRTYSSSGTWNGSTVNNGSKSSSGAQAGAFFTFDSSSNHVVHAKIGISFVSVANAQLNLNTEIAAWDFNGTRTNADTAWNNVLNKIQVSGGTTADLQTFYTTLYLSYFHPNIFDDVNGQYIGFDQQTHTVTSGHHQYENIPGWDQYRSLFSLRAILSPNETSDIAQSLVNDAKQSGNALPRWQQVNRNSCGMIGDSGDVEIANAYAFGATNFDTAGALSAMDNGASNSSASSDGCSPGNVRSGLSNWLSKGYIPNDGSLTLEYAADDFGISQFAKATGNNTLYLKYGKSAMNWQNLFNSANGGYLQPRNSDGTWPSFDPTSGTSYTEGTGAQYTWVVPFDLKDLTSKMGTNAQVVSRLDNFFTKLNDGISGTPYYYVGNEPDETIPWTYDYVGAPSHLQSVIRRIQTQTFSSQPNGMPGNTDAGAISSWYVFSAIGLYPEIGGVGGLVIGSPLFQNTTINLENGSTIQITAPNASDTNPYVQSMTLNGASSTSLWIPWSTLANGATLNFTLGSTASTWGSSAADAPPSFGSPSNGPTPTPTLPNGPTPTPTNTPTGGTTIKYEAESLTSTTSGPANTVSNDTNCSGGVCMVFQATAVGDVVTYNTGTITAGTYDLRVGVKKLGNKGIFQFGSNGVNHGSPVDLYAAASTYEEVDIGSVQFVTSGTKSFTFTVTGKNASSTGYTIGIDYIKLVQ